MMIKHAVFGAALAAAASFTLATEALAAPPTLTYWAATGDNGGLSGGFRFLNSGGVNPLSLPNSWTSWFPSDAVFDATFGGGGHFTNSGSWDNSTYIWSFGAPDTTSYGEFFTAPSTALNSFNFLIKNDSPGTDATFVLAAWDGSRAVGPAIYKQAVTLPSGVGYTWTSVNGLNVPLVAGNQYMAFLTVADVGAVGVPEPATWTMTILGFGVIGAALRRRKSPALA